MSTKVRNQARWQKIPDVFKVRENARVQPPTWLQVRVGPRKTSYRVNHRAGGIYLIETLVGDFKDWEEAFRRADEILARAKAGARDKIEQKLSCRFIIDQLIEESKSQDESTQNVKRLILLKHIAPWVEENCPLASDLNVSTWPRYKNAKRAADPTVALENHYKYFAMMCNRAFDLGQLKNRVRIKFDTKKEDFRESGRVFASEQLEKMIEVASSVSMAWHDRIIVQDVSGMRPGEVRHLRKMAIPHPRAPGRMLSPNVEFIEIDGRPAVHVKIFEEDSKTHQFRDFIILDSRAVHALKWRATAEKFADSPYFFPNERDHSKPMDKHLNGWYSVLEKAGVDDGFTPHDIRHTFATRLFPSIDGRQWAALCYQLGMTMEMAQGTYIHLDAKNTRGIAEFIASRAQKTGGAGQ